MKNELKENPDNLKWHTSKEAVKALKVKDCDLMHLRLKGKLKFKKEANRFFYLLDK